MCQSFADEQQCDTHWNLDLEFEDDTTIPEALKTLSTKTFENHTISVNKCEDGGVTAFDYILDEEFIWDLR